MPIAFDLEDLRKLHGCQTYLETGLWDPRVDVSSKLALKCNFEKVYCIEIRDDWVELGFEVFKDDIYKNRYKLIKDDSVNLSRHINNNCDFEKKTLFFLDAHVDNPDIHNFKYICPLFFELDAIGQLSRKDNVICVDDVRILKEMYPWGETKFGNINYVESIKDKIRTINPNYKFSYLNGHIENDVLIAYVEE